MEPQPSNDREPCTGTVREKEVDGPPRLKGEVATMVTLTEEQLTEVRLAVSARARATGAGTPQHETCNEILRRLEKGKDLVRTPSAKDCEAILSLGDRFNGRVPPL